MSRREKFIRQVKAAAARNFETYGRAAAMFVGQRKDGLVIMPLDAMTKDRAALAVQFMRRVCSMAAMVSECWMTERHPAAEITPPSECPDRKEILMITLYEGEKVTCLWAEIVRPEGRKPTLGPWLAFPGKGTLRGRFGDGMPVSEALQPWRQ